MNDNGDEPLKPHEVVNYVTDVVTQLAVMAHDAGLMRTAVALARVQNLARDELRRQPGKAAPDDAA